MTISETTARLGSYDPFAAVDDAALQQKSRDHLWMHFARHGANQAGADVPIMVRGDGHMVYDSHGKGYIDGLSGLFVVAAGHGRKRLAEMAAKQAETLSFFPIWSYAHPAAIELADRLADHAPGDLNKVFFSTGGGEAVETAFKLAKHYWKLRGKPMKHKVISRAVAYHGTPQGALAITGIPAMKQMFEPLTPGGLRVPNTNSYRADEMGFAGQTEEDFGVWAAERIREMIEFEGPDTVAAVFLEPVQNSGGCFTPPPGYFQRVREICDEYDVLLVSDEVICAFGRIGTMFACDTYGFVPDMITCAKAMTSGYSPIGATIISDRLFEPFAHGTRPSTTATRSAGTPSRPPSRWRTSTSSRKRAAAAERPAERPAVQGRAGHAPRPADRRGRPRCRVLLRHRAREGQGHQDDLRQRRVRAPAPRVPVEGAVRGRALLPRRRPGRPRRAARPAAHHRPAGVPRDHLDPAERAVRGRVEDLTGGPRGC